METALGLLLVALVLLGAMSAFFLIVVQPIWSLVEMIASDKYSGRDKIRIVLLSVFLGPIMTVYSWFAPQSRILRRATLSALAVLAFTAISVVTIVIAVPAARHPWVSTVGAATASGSGATPSGEGFAGEPLPAGEVTPFTALHIVRNNPSGWSVCIAQFTGFGPKADSTIPLVLPSIYPITHLAIDAENHAYYAITTHAVGRIIPETGRFLKFEINPAIGTPSWPSAIAYDSKQHVLLISAQSQGYSYSPATREWKGLWGFKDDGIIALTYSEDEGVVYALRAEFAGERATKLRKLSPKGARLAEVNLSQPIAVGRDPFPLAQLCWSGKQLIALISPPEPLGQTSGSVAKSAMYSLDPATGLCRWVDANTPIELEDASAGQNFSKVGRSGQPGVP